MGDRTPGRLSGTELIGGIKLRAEAAEDEAFLRRLFVAIRAPGFLPLGLPEPALAALLDQQFNAQRSQYRATLPDADWSIVEHEGVPIGRLYVLRTAARHHLVDISLLPEWSGQGIGGALLDRLCADAAAAGLPVMLHVSPANRAHALYLRKGFCEVALEGADIAMEWRPS